MYRISLYRISLFSSSSQINHYLCLLCWFVFGVFRVVNKKMANKNKKRHSKMERLYGALHKSKVGRPRKLREAKNIPLETIEAAIQKKCCSNGGCVLRCFTSSQAWRRPPPEQSMANAVVEEASVNYRGAFEFVKKYREKLEIMTKEERDVYLIARFKETILQRKVWRMKGGGGAALKKRFVHKFYLEEFEVCRNAWRMVYGFSKYEIDKASEALKNNWESTAIGSQRVWRDDHVHEYTYEETANIFVANSTVVDGTTNIGAFEDKAMIRAALSPTSEAQIYAKLYITDYVEAFADIAPNSNDEYVTAPTKKQVYEDYRKYCAEFQLQPIVLTQFYKMWSILFPTLRLRPWKNVVGKCDVCFEIDRMRKSGDCTRCEHEALKQLHHLHRGGMVMIEREQYKRRVMHALENPTKVLSMIIDGMDQNHSKCPFLGTQTQNAHALKQHIQGVLVHGTGVY